MRYFSLIVLSACAVLFGQAPNPDEWPIQHNIGHTNFSATTVLKPPFKIRWVSKIPGKFWSGPVVAQGKVVLQDNRGYLFCLDAETGEFLWRNFVNGLDEALCGSPAVFNNRVYASFSSYWQGLSGMRCYDLASGELLWKKPSGLRNSGAFFFGYQGHSPQVSGDRLYYFSVVDLNRASPPGPFDLRPQVQCWNALTGDSLWTFTLWDTLCKNGAMVVAGDTIFASVGHDVVNWVTDTGRTVALDKDGNLLWASSRHHVDYYIGGMQYVKGRLWMTEANGGLDVLSGSDGSLLQHYPPVSSRSTGIIMDDRYITREYGGSPVAYDLGTESLPALYPFRLFPQDPGFATGCSYVIMANGYLYTGFGLPAAGDTVQKGNKWYAWEAATGEPVWSFTNGTSACPPLAIAYGRLYAVTSAEGLVYCFENAQ